MEYRVPRSSNDKQDNMPSECKAPAVAVGSGDLDATEEVTLLDVQQMDSDDAQQQPQPSFLQQMDKEQELQQQQQQQSNDSDEQQLQAAATTIMSAAQRSSNNEPSTPQQEAVQPQPSTSQLQLLQNQTPSRQIQHLPTPQQQHLHSSPLLLTKVNGKGLWRSWKRNFQSKLLALMDLIDNSLDAAAVDSSSCRAKDDGCGSGNSDTSSKDDFIGRVHVYPDVLHETTTTNNNTTGIILINNSHMSIRPLQSILEVYNSSKTHSGTTHIGENGVGLKQGAATLSDLTFVLVKNRRRGNGVGDGGGDSHALRGNVLEEEEEEEGVIELGLIAESLQREEGCW